jgi:hypothetical protein
MTWKLFGAKVPLGQCTHMTPIKRLHDIKRTPAFYKNLYTWWDIPYYFEFKTHIFHIFSRWKLFKNWMRLKFEGVLYSKYYGIVARMWRLYIRRVLDWQLDLLYHTQLHTITVYTLLQFTTTLAESPHCVFTGCLPSNTRPGSHSKTDWRSARILTLLYSEDSLSATH